MASLHVAVLFGNEELTRKLLEEGYDANVYDERLGTPLSIAVLKGYRSIVKLLSEKGADHNNEGFTSALIHSRIDEFDLPDIISTSNKPRSQASKIQNSKTEQALPHDNETDRLSATDQDAPVGERPQIKILYRNGSKWEETPADEKTPLASNTIQLDEGVQEAYAIAQFMDRNDEGAWAISRIDIRTSKLCVFLSRVLEDYPGAGIGYWRTTLYPTYPNTPEKLYPEGVGLFHRMERYIKLSEEEIDPETETQAKALLQSLNPIWSSLQSVTEESRATGLMAWAHLWTIYKPGDTAILKQEGEDDNELSAARILEVKLVPERWHRPPFYEVTFEVLDWNGSYSGYRKEAYRIGQYDGLKKLGDIGFYPFSYDSNPEKLKERLIRRGRKFESLRGYFFMTREAFNVTRRIIIDNYAYYRFKRRRVPTYARLAGHSDSEDRSEAAIQGLSRSPSDTGNVRSIHSERNEDRRPLTDDECLLCVPTMKGFDIQEKIWNNVQVEDIENITWNDEAFNQLAIQEDRKRLVLAFTKQKQTEATEFDDFISGKGKSFIILLCGPPGVGKTLTAESVAERTRAPLYTVSASDLGTYVASVESSLKEALELCALWKAVMLIDEADVFLEARTPDSLKRNELVSVFLRLLEYYKGILFLTTNRAATIDAAFESRIDLIIPYDDFDQVARRQVWDNFANGLVGGSHELRDEDLNELSRLKLNGREIKSTVKTALMLANSEEDKLQAKHLQVVLEVRQRAEDYLHGKAQTSSNSNGSTKAETGLFGRWKWGWRSVRT